METKIKGEQMKKIKDPIKEMLNFHKEMYAQLDNLEGKLEKFKEDRNREGLRLSLDGFFFFIKKYLSLHIKDEEQALFPVLESLGDINKDVEQIINEHEVVRASVETLELLRDIKRESYENIEDKVMEIINTLRDHAVREEELILGPAEKDLTEKQKAFIAKKMNEFRKDTE